MLPIVSIIEINRPTSDVFDYVTDPSRFHEWQTGLMAGRMDRDPVTVGARCISTRNIGGRPRDITSEITTYEPPRRWTDHGLDGPMNPTSQIGRPIDVVP